MKTVLIVNQFAIPPARSGGTRHHVLAKGLVKQGYRVVLLTSSSNYATGDVGSGGTVPSEVVEGVEYLYVRQTGGGHSLARRLWAMLHFSVHVVRARKRLAARPDIVLGSSPSLFAAVGAALLARRLGVPFVLEVRDLWPLSLIEILQVSAHHPLVLTMARLEAWLYRTARAVVTPLENAKRHIDRVAGTPKQVLVIPNGVDPDLFGALERPIPRPDGVLTAIYAGAHGPANALDVYVEAAHRLQARGESRVRLRFYGNGSDRERLMAKAKALGLRNIGFCLPVPKERMAGVLAEGDVFLINIPASPLYAYGFSPNKLFDYMYAGRPLLIGTDVRDNPVSRADGGQVLAPDDPDALADALVAMCEQPHEERIRQGQNARRYVEEHHNMPELSKRLEHLLRTVIEEGQA